MVAALDALYSETQARSVITRALGTTAALPSKLASCTNGFANKDQCAELCDYAPNLSLDPTLCTSAHRWPHESLQTWSRSPVLAPVITIGT